MTPSTLRTATKVLAAAGDMLRTPANGVVILLYHRVGAGSGLDVDLPVGQFDEQMALIREQRLVLGLDPAVHALVDGAFAPNGPPPVVVTFDDGTADFVDRALPVLVAHRVPATLYVATDHIERRISFPHDGKPVSWQGLRDAISTGLITVGSHTHHHALLDRLAPGDVDDELDRSIALIEDRLGIEAAHFAYPKAVAGSAHADQSVRRRFRSAALGGNRANPYGRTDVHRLARSAVQTSDGMRWFDHKLRGGMGLEDDIRRALNRRRYAHATT
jgi:peptidoglycan/xylan/chitin deacetylase (PgdA/CDA1 family)